MVEVEAGRIYEVLNPRDPPSWTATKGVQRSKTVGAISSGHRAQNGFANYAVPRYVYILHTSYYKLRIKILLDSQACAKIKIYCAFV